MKRLTFDNIRKLTDDQFHARDESIAKSGEDLRALEENYNVISFCRHNSDYYDEDTDSYIYSVDVQLNDKNQTYEDISYCISLDYEYNDECMGCGIDFNNDNEFSSDNASEDAKKFLDDVLNYLRNLYN